jgi:hypothetical protein
MLAPAAIATTKTAAPKANGADFILGSFVSCGCEGPILAQTRRGGKEYGTAPYPYINPIADEVEDDQLILSFQTDKPDAVLSENSAECSAE